MATGRWAAGATSAFTWPLAIGALIVALDQATKALVVATIGPNAGDADGRIDLIGSVASLRYAENTGAAFGVLQGQGALLTVGSVVVLAGLVAAYWRVGAESRATAVAAGLLVGGAIGNLIDRVRLGFVVDFVSVGPWPAFNLADSAITAGVLLFAWWGIVRSPQPAGPPGARAAVPSGSGDGPRVGER